MRILESRKHFRKGYKKTREGGMWVKQTHHNIGCMPTTAGHGIVGRNWSGNFPMAMNELNLFFWVLLEF